MNWAHTIFINLDARTDRLAHFEKEWAKLDVGVQPTRLNAVRLQKGAIGCSLSHIKALELAKANGWPYALICEDDMTLVDAGRLRKQVEAFLQESGRVWDVVLLGGNNWPPFEPVDDSCIRIHNCNTTVAYLVRAEYYDTMLANFKEGAQQFMRSADKPFLYAIDIWWKQLQIRDRWFLLTPPSVSQWEGSWSDVEGRPVSYSHLMMQHDKREAWLPKTAAQLMPKMAAQLMPKMATASLPSLQGIVQGGLMPAAKAGQGTMRMAV
jgi:GR25 family glycosyltransferase involved in LPS biosynthesis